MAITLIVEDGTGKSDANAYCSIAFADQYHEDHGNGEWTSLTDDQKKSGIIDGTQYLDTQYLWDGTATTSTQALVWPRVGVIGRNSWSVDSDEVPLDVQKATAELALRSSAAALRDDLERPLSRLKAGSAELQWEDSTSTQESKRYPDVDALVQPYVSGTTQGGGATIEVALI